MELQCINNPVDSLFVVREKGEFACAATLDDGDVCEVVIVCGDGANKSAECVMVRHDHLPVCGHHGVFLFSTDADPVDRIGYFVS